MRVSRSRSQGWSAFPICGIEKGALVTGAPVGARRGGLSSLPSFPGQSAHLLSQSQRLEESWEGIVFPQQPVCFPSQDIAGRA